MFASMLFVVSGVFGTILALRLMALEETAQTRNLTVRGRIVIGLIAGLVIATFIIVVCGMWWDCDLRAGATTQCSIRWGY